MKQVSPVAVIGVGQVSVIATAFETYNALRVQGEAGLRSGVK